MPNQVARELEALFRQNNVKAEFSYLPRNEKDRALLADALDSGEEGDKTDPEFLSASVYVKTREEKGEAGLNNSTGNSIIIRMSGANTYVPFVGDKVRVYGNTYRLTEVEPRRLNGEVSKYTLKGVQ